LRSLDRALDALRAGRLDQAENIGRQIVKESPKNPGASLLLAAIALRRGNYREASRWAHATLQLQRDHPRALIIAGRAARAQNHLVQAAAHFRRASELLPDRPEAAFLLCAVELDSGDPGANTTLERILRQFPHHAEGWNDVGMSLRRKNQLEAALVAFGRATEGSSAAAAFVNLGSTYLTLGRRSEALPAFRRAAALGNTSEEILLPLALGLRHAGALQEAREQLDHLAVAMPQNASVLFSLGLVCDDLGDGLAAIAAYRRCIEAQPNFAEAHVNLGLAIQQSGNMEAAMDCYRRAVRLAPDTFGRIAQALCSQRRGQIWLNLNRLRRSLTD
jgi:tetratricopeptide (TPR) repeat protein